MPRRGAALSPVSEINRARGRSKGGRGGKGVSFSAAAPSTSAAAASLEEQQHELLNAMQANQARKEDAASHLLGHYKAEAERLLTMTQRSKSVARTEAVGQVERENASLKAKVLELESRILAMERGGAVVLAAAAGPTAAELRTAEQRVRALKKQAKAFEMLTGAAVTIDSENRAIGVRLARADGGAISFELEVDDDEDEIEVSFTPAADAGLSAPMDGELTVGEEQVPKLFASILAAALTSAST